MRIAAPDSCRATPGNGLKIQQYGRLIAIRIFRAMDAVRPYFLRQHILVNFHKTKFPEKLFLVRQRKDTPYAEAVGFAKTLLDNAPAQALPAKRLIHHKRTYFRQILPDNGKSATGRQASVIKLSHIKIPHMLIQVCERPRQKLPLAGAIAQKFLDSFHVANAGFAKTYLVHSFRSKS
jgi:hypothetical protein